jgi:hypothetical protein
MQTSSLNLMDLSDFPRLQLPDGPRPQSNATLRPSSVLFVPKLFDQTARRRHHIVERQHCVLPNIATQYATLGKTNWQRSHTASRGGIVDQAVGTEAAHTIKPFASLQISLGNGHHFADGPSDRGNSRITMDNRPPQRRGNLDMRQMKRNCSSPI